jgi:hypothetical protein
MDEREREEEEEEGMHCSSSDSTRVFFLMS